MEFINLERDSKIYKGIWYFFDTVMYSCPEDGPRTMLVVSSTPYPLVQYGFWDDALSRAHPPNSDISTCWEIDYIYSRLSKTVRSIARPNWILVGEVVHLSLMRTQIAPACFWNALRRMLAIDMWFLPTSNHLRKARQNFFIWHHKTSSWSDGSSHAKIT